MCTTMNRVRPWLQKELSDCTGGSVVLWTNFRASKASGPNPALPLPGHEHPLSFRFHICKMGHTILPSRDSCGYFR